MNQKVHPLDRMGDSVVPRDRSTGDTMFRYFCVAVASLSIVFLAVLLISILVQGIGSLNGHFLSHYPEADPALAGIRPAMMGTVWVLVVCGLFALPIGVATAIFLEEFQPQNRLLRWLHSVIQLNITNLAGVPSVVYGILGLTLFASMFGLFGRANDPAFQVGMRHYDQFMTLGEKVVLVPVSGADADKTVVAEGMKAQNYQGIPVEINVFKSKKEARKHPDQLELALIEGKTTGRIQRPSFYSFQLPLGRSVLAGSLTLMLVILPIIIISSQEALRAVPGALREAGLGMGATRWQVVRNVTLPSAIPGIMTGSILAMSRAIGEAAPILILAGTVFITFSPTNLMDTFTVMPLQIFDWTTRPQSEFRSLAAAGSIVLLTILFFFNLTAVLIRQRAQNSR